MKKLLAILMAMLMLITGSSLAAFAADVEVPSEPESETEPEITYKTYEICKDLDFADIQFMDKGNDAATILLPGDHITTYKSNSTAPIISYYPDADAVAVKGWTPADANNLAFSTSGKVYIRDASFNKNDDAVVKGIDFTDFTIAYSEENVFVGWVMKDFNEQSNVISLYAVWKKDHKVPHRDDVDDFYYIIDHIYSLRKAISEPFFKAIKTIANALLFVKQWLYDKVFTPKAAA